MDIPFFFTLRMGGQKNAYSQHNERQKKVYQTVRSNKLVQHSPKHNEQYQNVINP
jgi:hypothetical protein